MAPRKTTSAHSVSEGGTRRSSRLQGFSPSKSENTVSDSPIRKRGRNRNGGAPKPTTKAVVRDLESLVSAAVKSSNTAFLGEGKKDGDVENSVEDEVFNDAAPNGEAIPKRQAKDRPKHSTKAADKKIEAKDRPQDVEPVVAHEGNKGADVQTMVAAAVEWAKTAVPDEGNKDGVVEKLVEEKLVEEKLAAPNDETIPKERKKSIKHPLHCVRNGSMKRATNHGSGMFRYL